VPFSLSLNLASAQAQKQLSVEPSTQGVAGSSSIMVKPTKSSDAIVSTNRFAILGAATFESQNPETLAEGGGTQLTEQKQMSCLQARALSLKSL
jgi:hypothetical protein